MRAGPYAEWNGRTWTIVSVNKPFVRLLADGDQPKPEGFELDRSGRWTRVVDRSEVTRIFRVETTASWRGHTVRISHLDGGLAQFTYFGMGLPETPDVARVQSDEWHGVVPVDELSDVLEVVHEVPL